MNNFKERPIEDILTDAYTLGVQSLMGGTVLNQREQDLITLARRCAVLENQVQSLYEEAAGEDL